MLQTCRPLVTATALCRLESKHGARHCNRTLFTSCRQKIERSRPLSGDIRKCYPLIVFTRSRFFSYAPITRLASAPDQTDSKSPNPSPKPYQGEQPAGATPTPHDGHPARGSEEPSSAPKNARQDGFAERRAPSLRSMEDKPIAMHRSSVTPALETETLPQEQTSLSVRLAKYLDPVMGTLAVLSQRFNELTGTDYTGITALRNSIMNQEQHVKSCYYTTNNAKASHSRALDSQAARQKEVVGLLERKSSWSATDLERYMSLIRREHTEEEAVSRAAEELTRAEKNLEDARIKLEKIERRQYHEEQIWSDTIRRNSTWVTIGLMGLNIFLLLATLVIFEPWRRRRLVREIKKTLDEKQAAALAAIAVSTVGIDGNTPPTVGPFGQTEATTPLPLEAQSEDGPLLPSLESNPTFVEPEPESRLEYLNEGLPSSATSWQGILLIWQDYWLDLFSDRTVAVRKVDLTTATLEGIAAGVTLASMLVLVFRFR